MERHSDRLSPFFVTANGIKLKMPSISLQSDVATAANLDKFSANTNR